MATPQQVDHLQPLVLTDNSHHSASIIIATSTLLFTNLMFLVARLWIRSLPDSEQRRGASTRDNILGVDDIFSTLSVVSATNTAPVPPARTN